MEYYFCDIGPQLTQVLCHCVMFFFLFFFSGRVFHCYIPVPGLVSPAGPWVDPTWGIGWNPLLSHARVAPSSQREGNGFCFHLTLIWMPRYMEPKHQTQVAGRSVGREYGLGIAMAVL